MHIRRSADLQNVEDLVRYWMVLPQCSITCQTDDTSPVKIGFEDARSVVQHFFGSSNKIRSKNFQYEIVSEVDEASETAYVIAKWDYMSVWDFETMYEMSRAQYSNEAESSLRVFPGMCIEGIRVRSVPAGYSDTDNSPWIFVNLIGRTSPKTNVARSDIEASPELDKALLRVYSVLGKHIQGEFDRLVRSGIGLVEASREVDAIRSLGLEQSSPARYNVFRQAMDELRIIALEERDACRAVTSSEMEKLGDFWTVDSDLIHNLEGICGSLGINLPARQLITSLGKDILPAIPLPRLLGRSMQPIVRYDVTKVHIYAEENSRRIDIRWQKEVPGRWRHVPNELLGNSSIHGDYGSIWLTEDASISAECPDFELVRWRGFTFIFANSVVPTLCVTLGITGRFGRWLGTLLQRGEIPSDEQAALKAQLNSADQESSAKLMSHMILPFERRFGDDTHSRYRRSALWINS